MLTISLWPEGQNWTWKIDYQKSLSEQGIRTSHLKEKISTTKKEFGLSPIYLLVLNLPVFSLPYVAQKKRGWCVGDRLFNMDLRGASASKRNPQIWQISLGCDLGGSGPAKSFPKIFIKQQLVMLFTNSPDKKPVSMFINYLHHQKYKESIAVSLIAIPYFLFTICELRDGNAIFKGTVLKYQIHKRKHHLYPSK